MKKMNMVEKFGAIKAMLNGETVDGFSIAEALKFLDGRISQVEKKNASGANADRKPTKTQLENEGIKETIMTALRTYTDPVSLGDLSKGTAELGELSNQKLSALVTQLVKCGKVERTEVKGKAYFAIVTED
jgi:hypothetical protein